jgi:periplasmic protein TonB
MTAGMFAFLLVLLAQSAQPPVAVADSPPPVIAPPVIVLPPAPPPPPAARLLRPPLPRHQPQSLIMPDDYPASALAAKQEGKVGFTLDVGPDGRVHGCTITRSSGSSVLDSVTCSIMRRRGRFTPAVDSNGQPVAGRVRYEVEWVLPGATERG